MFRRAVAVICLAACAHTPETAAPSVKPIDPTVRIARAVASIDTASFRRDVQRLEGERNTREAEHLAASLDYVEHEFIAAGFTTTRQAVRSNASNIIAERGGDGRVVMASAHIDTVRGSPGADDNASGIAVLLAIARAARAVPTNGRIRLCAFTLEESGLLGSKRYVASLSPESRAEIAGLYNFDMIAFTRHEPDSQKWPDRSDILADIQQRKLPTVGDFIGAVGIAGDPNRPMRALLEARAYVPGLTLETMEIPPLLLRFAPDLSRGDHAPFWDAGISAVVLGDTAELRSPHYHMPSDTMDTLDFDTATRVARLAAATMLIAAGVR